jgi:hypothetical protein
MIDNKVRELIEAIKYFLIFCSGADIETVKETKLSSEENKYLTIGSVIIAITILAACSGALAARTFFGRSLDPSSVIILSIISGVIWGMFVFSIDRYFTMSIKKKSNSKKIDSLVPAAIRIAFSVILSSVIAMPLEVEMFRPSIERQIAEDNQEKISIILRKVETAKEKLASDSRIRIAKIKDNINLIDQLIKENDSQFNKERQGIGVSKLKGEGTSSNIYKDKIKENQDEKKEFISERQRLKKSTAYKQKMIDENAITEMEYYGFRRENAPELFSIKKSAKTKQKGGISDATLVTNTKNSITVNGLEREIEALEEISKRPAIFWWKWLITTMLVIIEITPVSLKMLFPYSPYDTILETKEKRVLKREDKIREKFLGREIYNDLKVEEDIRDAIREYKKKQAIKENEQSYNAAASQRRQEREVKQKWFNLIINKIKSKLFGKDWEDWIDKRAEELGEELFGKRSIKQNVNSLIKKTANFIWMPATFLLGGLNSVWSEVYKKFVSRIGDWIVEKFTSKK